VAGFADGEDLNSNGTRAESAEPLGGRAGALVAVLPILLGGDLGHVTILQTSATLEMEFLRERALSFVNVTICQHSFTVGPYELTLKTPLVFRLPSPCVPQSH
jgi:hypothetical protein